jgi:hypothetical protein
MSVRVVVTWAERGNYLLFWSYKRFFFFFFFFFFLVDSDTIDNDAIAIEHSSVCLMMASIEGEYR